MILADVAIPGMSNIECEIELKEVHPGTQVVVATVLNNAASVFHALQAGDFCHLVKRGSSTEISEANNEIDTGGALSANEKTHENSALQKKVSPTESNIELSEREREIFELLSKGLVNKEIADKLSISYHTVRVHMKHIYEKLNVRSRSEALLIFFSRQNLIMMARRRFLQHTGVNAIGLAPTKGVGNAEQARLSLTPPAEIEARVREARPLRGGKIPADLVWRLGTTHYDGHYFLTNKPYLLEGAEAIERLGMRVVKFWLREHNLLGYGYNSDWQITRDARLVDMLKHKYYIAALDRPFTTVVFEIFPLSQKKDSYLDIESDFADEEKQFYEMAAYLLKVYANREITFILQHLEGDWMLRGREGASWVEKPTKELQRRCSALIRFLAARQHGVERARHEAYSSRCKVYHAAEVNRVWDSKRGIPTFTTHILPHVTLDLVSWSSYDGMNTAVETWQGVELIRQSMRPSPVFGNKAIYIGAIGKPENEATKSEIIEWWDRALGVFFALDMPWIINWELYCNEPNDGAKWDRRSRKAEEMRGFWLIRPDGSLSHSGKYFTMLLKYAGQTLPKSMRKK
jgi:DNA-binding NarL/FixJ family response regulator